METEKLTEWERVICSRCGGSGQYSYCQSYGTTCFKCGGKKKVLTARAMAALAWLKGQRQTPVGQLVAGMKVRTTDLTLSGQVVSRVQVLREIDYQSGTKYMKDGKWHSYIALNFDKGSVMMFPESTVEVIPTDESERVAQVRAAIEYQNTLTKAGKPRARK